MAHAVDKTTYDEVLARLGEWRRDNDQLSRMFVAADRGEAYAFLAAVADAVADVAQESGAETLVCTELRGPRAYVTISPYRSGALTAQALELARRLTAIAHDEFSAAPRAAWGVRAAETPNGEVPSPRAQV